MNNIYIIVLKKKIIFRKNIITSIIVIFLIIKLKILKILSYLIIIEFIILIWNIKKNSGYVLKILTIKQEEQYSFNIKNLVRDIIILS